mgnify:CR=1 FL=1
MEIVYGVVIGVVIGVGVGVGGWCVVDSAAVTQQTSTAS